jgi:lysozyme family protein
MNRIDAIIERVIARESDKFTNNPNDSGGPTKYGITQASLSRYLGRPATIIDVQSLDKRTAREFYFWKHVHEPEFDKVVAIDEPIGAELIDTGVLCGPARAAIFLQRGLNAFNLRGSHYPDLQVDGDVGPATRAALRAYIAKRGVTGSRVLIGCMNSQLGNYLLELVERRPKDEDFAFGWFLNRVVEEA